MKRNGTFNSTFDLHSLYTDYLTFEDERLAYQRPMYVYFYHFYAFQNSGRADLDC